MKIEHTQKENLFGKTLSELTLITQRLKMTSFKAKQIANWLYVKKSHSINEMTNISVSDQAKLSENFTVERGVPSEVIESQDGTKKYLFETFKGKKLFETVLIPSPNRSTVCMSSQVGCKMACHFCMTGRQGFGQHLKSVI